jgi:hypothetical protein
LLVACDQQQLASKKPQPLPDPQSLGAQLMNEYCSSCHAPPRPGKHNAEEWIHVVERMQTHRIRRALGAMSTRDQQILTSYLQEHAKPD